MTEQINKPKILIVDDQFLLNMYVLKFQKGGYEVETAENADEAMTKLKELPNAYGIIILDIIMPGMNGMELLKKIRNEKLADPKTTIVMLTNQADDYERAESLGADGYIIKATTVPAAVVNQVIDIYNKKK